MKVRQDFCDECWRECRYAQHTVGDATNFYSDTKQGLEDAVASGLRTGSKAFITRHTVLGRMHETKQQSWNHMVSQCPHRGQDRPQDIFEFLEWAAKLKPLSVRLALGYEREAALRLKTALKVYELTAYVELLGWKQDEDPVAVESALRIQAGNSDGEVPF